MWHLGNALGGTSTPTLLSKVKAPFPLSSFISVVAHRRHKLLTRVSLPLCSCTNWTETQREKSFWMISSASCKKEVRSSACVCVRACVHASACASFFPHNAKSAYLSLAWAGFFFMFDDCFMVVQPPPCCSQANQDAFMPGNGLTYLLLAHTAACPCTHTYTHTCLIVTQPPHRVFITVTHTS